MATDFTQDAVLHFLQSSGGSVKNSDLLLHFRNFIRNHADQERNRELFKKFVNSVATVRQEDGVSYVVLRKKFRGQVPGDGGGGSHAPPRAPAARSAEPCPESAILSAAVSADKPRLKSQLREAKTPAPAGDTGGRTILPAAGIKLNNNNNNVETNLNLKRKQQQQQVTNTSEVGGRAAAAAQVLAPISRSEPPLPDRGINVVQQNAGSGPHPGTKVAQQSAGSGPHPGTKVAQQSAGSVPLSGTKVAQQSVSPAPLPGTTPVVPAVRHHGETGQQVPVSQTLQGRETCLQPVGGLHQEPPLHHVALHPRVSPRRIRHRQSYKSAVSQDDDEEEEEEELAVRRGSAGGVWPPSAPLGETGRAISTSSPCLIDSPTPPSVSSSSSSASSERNLPKIYIQGVEGEMLPPLEPGWSFEPGVGPKGDWTGLEHRSVSAEATSKTNSRPLVAQRFTPSQDAHRDRSSGVQPEPRQGLHQSQRAWLSSSHSSIFSPSSDAGFSSSDWPPSGSTRGTARNSSYEDLQARTGDTEHMVLVQDVLQRSYGNRLEPAARLGDGKTTATRLRDDRDLGAHSSPFRHSSDNLQDDPGLTMRVLPWHLSTGDLCDDQQEAESSEGSAVSSPVRLRPAAVRRLSSQQRTRMCRSLGADLDQLLQEEARRGGSEAARLNRLHLLSSSLSLHCNLSSSSLSSCSTPPRCHSLVSLVEGVEPGKDKGPPAAAAHHEGSSRQLLVPLEPREHAWLVKAAAGAWPDIYSLFREDWSLLNRRDFISGFTVLHWIAKHGDHRVLNTLWYGVQKAGLAFDINARSTCGHTPLHIAAIHGSKNIMRLLVNKFGADVKLRDTAGKKPWQYLSCAAPPDVFQLLGAPARAAVGGRGGVWGGETSWEQKQQQQQQQQHHRRRRRHHISSASSGERPITIAGTIRVKRSSSIAAFLKHKSMLRFHGRQSDSSA